MRSREKQNAADTAPQDRSEESAPYASEGITLALDLTGLRVQRLYNDMRERVLARKETGSIHIYPPTDAEINHIIQALMKARDTGVNDALRPVIDECDTLKKGPALEAMTRIYDALHAMKYVSFALAVAEAKKTPQNDPVERTDADR